MHRRHLAIIALGALTGCDLVAGISDNEYTRSGSGGGGGGGGGLEAGACGIYWTRVLKGIEDDAGTDIVFATTGEVVVGGHFAVVLGDGDGTEVGAVGGDDLFFARFARSGSLLDLVARGSSANGESLVGLAALPAGAFAAVGSGPGGETVLGDCTVEPGGNAWAATLDAGFDGQVCLAYLQDPNSASSSAPEVRDVAARGSQIIVAGQARFTGVELGGQVWGEEGSFFAPYDVNLALGTPQFVPRSEAARVAITAAGDALFAGEINDNYTVFDQLPDAGGLDRAVWVARFPDPGGGGQPAWVSSFGLADGAPSGLAATPGGGAVVVGTWNTTIVLGGTPYSAADGTNDNVLVQLIDGQGNWGNGLVIEGVTSEVIADVAVGAGGAIYVTGQIGSDHGQPIGGATSCDDGSVASSLFVMKLNPQLGVEWLRRFGALSGSATGAALVVDEAANLVVVTGTVTDEVTVGDHLLDATGQDVFVIAMTAE